MTAGDRVIATGETRYSDVHHPPPKNGNGAG